MMNKFCFLSEANYPNYVKRIKEYSLKRYLELNLDIPFYITTNIPEEFHEYKDNPLIRVFGIDELRKNNINSLINEKLPDDPTGLYPARYPWNLRRFILRKAAEDGYNGLFFIECDTKVDDRLDKHSLIQELELLFEPNTVKTSSARFVYKHRSPGQELFHYHESYISDLGLNFIEDDYDTLDGTNQIFLGESPQSIINFVNNWDYICDYGYMNRDGYKTGYLSNLSFIIPMSGFKLKHTNTPFRTDHVFEDRYTYENKINSPNTNVSDVKSNSIEYNSITEFFDKYYCDKTHSGYDKTYNLFFPKIQKQEMNILEIGVGSVSDVPPENMGHTPASMIGWKQKNPDYNPGASLRALRDYFVNSKIYGVDIQKDCEINEERIQTFIFNSTNKISCDSLINDNFFDMIIDDGDHDPVVRLKTLNNFFSKLTDNGYYIIEGVIDGESLTSYLSNNNFNFKFYNNNLIIINKNNEIIPSTIEISSNYSETLEQPEIINNNDPVEFTNTGGEFKINELRFADRGFFINLNTSTDRLRLVKEQILKYKIEGLDRFEALTDEWRQFSCTKSHLKVFENSLNDGYEIIFIAEDDFLIEDYCYYPKGGNQKVFDVLSKVHDDLSNVEWDVLLFGCNPKSPLIPITNNLAIVNKSTGAWAYLIKKRAFKYLLENSNYRRDLIAVDDWLPILNDRGFTTITTIPLTINHGVGLISTLQPSGPVNYDGWIKGSYHKFLYDIYDKDNLVKKKLETELTIVIAGHFVDNFIFYLNYLFHSLPDELKKCKILINYDESGDGDIGMNKFSLESFFKDVRHGMNTTISYSNGGLISSIDNTLYKIKTPYFLFLEHDWVFLNKDGVNFDKLIECFNNNNFVHSVWLSKDDNILRGFEITEDIDGAITPFELESRVSEINLTTTCRWSNNPAVFRASKFKEWFETIIKNEHVGKVNQGPHNVEETMIPHYREQIKKFGWNNIRDNWGTYLYGNIGEGPYVGHTDASKRYQGHNKSAPEINGENYIKNNPL
jgi:GR25 family glycosyltransferase involved in LPS biosynthesis